LVAVILMLTFMAVGVPIAMTGISKSGIVAQFHE
jgi:hypothetical protein